MINQFKYYKCFLLLAIITLSANFKIYSQIKKAETFKISITDESGNKISGVKIYNSKGKIFYTNNKGNSNVQVVKDDKKLVLEKKGFKDKTITFDELTTTTIIMQTTLRYADDQDKTEVAFGTTVKREINNPISTLTPNDFGIYDNRIFVNEIIGNRFLGMKSNSSIRGFGGSNQALIVVDGVLGRNINNLTLQEVEQISVLKDAASVAMYGSQALNGVIQITTKRGKANRREINVRIDSGVRQPLALPDYLNAPEYMTLYNEALVNDGLSPIFSNILIQNTLSGENPYLYPDIDFYSSDYVKPFAPTYDIGAEFLGGNDRMQYYVNLGWSHQSSLENLAPDVNKGSNSFSIRGNLDFKINDKISSTLDANLLIRSNQSARSDLGASVFQFGTTFLPNQYAPILPLEYMLLENNDILAEKLAGANIYDGGILGYSQTNPTPNPLAAVYAGGSQNDMTIYGQFTNTVNFDLNSLLTGLSGKTRMSFDLYDQHRLQYRNTYNFYNPIWVGNQIFDIDGQGEDDQQGLTQFVTGLDYDMRFGASFQLDHQANIDNIHNFKTTLLGYYNSITTDVISGDGTRQTYKYPHLGLSTSYTYRDKLMLDVSATQNHSIKLPKGNRAGISTTSSIGYILSEENFIKNTNFIDFLKLKASTGILYSDLNLGLNSFYLYEPLVNLDNGSFNWQEGVGNNRVSFKQGANSNLGFEKRVDLNIGFEALLWNSLSIEFNAFQTDIEDKIIALNTPYPSYYDDFKAFENFEADRYRGLELGLNYTKSWSDFRLNFGGNFMLNDNTALIRDEERQYAYQNRQGISLNPIFGYQNLGFYGFEDFDASGNVTNNLPDPQAQVQPGDIKYVNQNPDDDNVIDNFDQVYLGRGYNPISYNLNLQMTYKRLTLYLQGVGQSGGISRLTNSYFQVTGNDKYSERVVNRWTPATAATATYPRLSTGNANNNFKNSDFWIYSTSYFNLSRAQLTYEVSEKLCKKLGMKQLSVHASGSDLFRIAKDKDIQLLRIGSAPRTRNILIGLRTSF